LKYSACTFEWGATLHSVDPGGNAYAPAWVDALAA
jgi:hypothetical protein